MQLSDKYAYDNSRQIDMCVSAIIDLNSTLIHINNKPILTARLQFEN